MTRALASTLLALLLALPATARAAGPLPIVAAENMYGDVAMQIGGAAVSVTSVLHNPGQDPHLFEASPSVARAIAAARIAVCNGADYDPWMTALLGAVHGTDRDVISVAALADKRAGDNPHLWYDSAVMRTYAQALAKALERADPAHAAAFRQRLAHFVQSLQPIEARIAAMRQRYAGAAVTATEPVFGYMFQALGLQVRNEPFQVAVMNDTEPSASQMAAFETDLRQHRVRLLVYNSQASSPVAQRMRDLATASHIPVVAVTETEPPGETYQHWMLQELDAIDHALGG